MTSARVTFWNCSNVTVTFFFGTGFTPGPIMHIPSLRVSIFLTSCKPFLCYDDVMHNWSGHTLSLTCIGICWRRLFFFMGTIAIWLSVLIHGLSSIMPILCWLSVCKIFLRFIIQINCVCVNTAWLICHKSVTTTSENCFKSTKDIQSYTLQRKSSNWTTHL